MVWAGSAPYDAALAIRSGRATYVLNTFSVAWATQRPQMVGGPGHVHAEDLFKQNLEVPFGWFPQPVYFATIARRHMHEFGTTPEQLGAIAVACRRHAGLTPGAVMRDKPLTLDDYLRSPMIAEPFRKEDCCLISDGGAAYIMTSLERARDLRQPIVAVLGVGVGNARTGAYWSQQGAFTSTPQVFAAPGAFAMAGVRPADVDVLACYDPFTIVSLMQIEDMGFCAKGDGGPFVAGDTLHFDVGPAALQHARRHAVARLRPRHRPRRRDRPPTAPCSRGPGARRNRRHLRRIHRPAGQHAHPRETMSASGLPAPRRDLGADARVLGRSGARRAADTRCDACGRFVWYPQTPCRHCGGARLTWTEVSGRGRLFSWSVVRYAWIPQFADRVPFVTGLVALEEDPNVRLVTYMVDCASDALRCDMPVRVVFRPLRYPGVEREVSAPMFIPAGA